MKIIRDFKELLRISKKLRNEGKTLVFTNGCFDILTVAHVRSLQEGKKYGNVLIVGLNSDASVKHLKGNNRPVIPEEQRAEILAQLPYVDYIYIFPWNSPLPILQAIKPEIYLKGGDYKKRINKSGCREFVKNYGGKIILTKFIPDISTTKIIERIKKL